MKVMVHWAREGDGWIAWAEEVPGIVARGRTVEEARRNLMDATNAYLDEADENDFFDLLIMEDLFEG